MAKKVVSKKKPNAQDATLRNINALKKRIVELERLTSTLELGLEHILERVEALIEEVRYNVATDDTEEDIDRDLIDSFEPIEDDSALQDQ